MTWRLSGGQIPPVEGPPWVIRPQQAEVAVPGLRWQDCWRGERDVSAGDGEAPAEARDRLDMAGHHRVGRDAQEAVRLPAHVAPGIPGRRVEELGPNPNAMG